MDETASDDIKDRRNNGGRRFSAILTALAADESRERISVADIFAAMGDRAFGALMLIFALPNIIPTPPGTSAILGAPLVFLAAQMTVGMTPWLPQLIARRSMLRTDFAALVLRLGPWLARAERLLTPRLVALTRGPAERLIGAVSLILAVILFLPLPLGNILPALTISLFSLAMLERDGLWVVAGLVMSVVSLVVVGSVVVAAIVGTLLLIQQVFA